MKDHLPTILRLQEERNRRARSLPEELFGEPCWDMLLDLAHAAAIGRDISITSACIAARVPPTTALRYIEHLQDCGMIERQPDPCDNRRTFLRLTERAAIGLAAHFATLETSLA